MLYGTKESAEVLTTHFKRLKQ